ncbi:MAG: sigma-70 family RNA polymerase sigma factor [Acidimicrobiia bacterium]|nr:sigma-70 family RNA polymerase sigma factor [Acidimicrobiia bacterium]
MGPAPTETDHELIVAAIEGDVASFGRLVGRYQRDALRIAVVALGSSTDADDVAQDAFVKVHRALPGFDLTAPFRPWLYRIVVNTARSRQRTGRRIDNLRLRVSAFDAASSTATADGPADIAVHLDQRRRLVDAINRLSADDRLILTYRWYEQLSEAEIADALDCPAGTVKSRLSRAMQRLRTELTEMSEP